MKVLDALKNKKYLAIAVASSITMSLLYIYTQVLGNLHNADIWFSIIPWYNALLFIIFAALFGITLAFQIYVKTRKVCGIRGSAGTTGAVTFASFLVAQCPACASLGALLLPASVFQIFIKYSPFINILSISLLLFTIHYLGGFRK
ncbi:MAG: hypothetical protein HYT72_03955 [Candidatus Aenigmarchaeota archaeon]|nr:hypothetical protein [Candidatus Aenigmarchaeota archaeon]